MSAEDVSKFENQVKSDPDLLAKLHALKGTDQGALSEKIAQVGRDAGYSVSASEVDDYLKNAVTGGELSDEALSGIAGGHWTYSWPGC